MSIEFGTGKARKASGRQFLEIFGTGALFAAEKVSYG